MNMEENDKSLELIISMHAGQLADLINLHNAKAIRTLKLKGEINGSDVKTIRMMTYLQELDLTEAVIVSGGEPYYEQYVIEDNIIGKYSFDTMTCLKKILLPSTIKAIHSCAFSDCTSLSAISIPASVEKIGNYAFGGCISLKEVVIEDGDKFLDFPHYGLVFKDCPIEYVYLGREIDYLCTDLDSEWYYESYDSPFKDNPLLALIEVGNRVADISPWAFSGCTGLKSVLFRGTTENGYNSFCQCGKISQLVLSNGASFIDLSDYCEPVVFSKVVFTCDVTDIDVENMNYYCNTITKIHMECNIPPAVRGNATEEVDKHKCTLIVPAGSADKYRHACYWKDFGNIVELDE